MTGKSQPDLSSILLISNFLQVSPCWLAFGGSDANLNKANEKFFIKKIFINEIFSNLLTNVLGISFTRDKVEKICEFLYGIINDIAQLEATDEMKLRLIRTSVKSALISEASEWLQKA